jgi:hypothetical protein
MKQLLQHQPDCTPLHPCAVCELVAWLREKLDATDFAHLVERLNDLEPPASKRPYRKRNRSSAATNKEPAA